VEVLQKSGLIPPVQLETYLQQLYAETAPPNDPPRFAARFVRDGLLSNFQAQQLLKGRYRNFTIGKYRILEPLGTGGMGKVFLAEHLTMKHRVALKILPIAPNDQSSQLARFRREARASGALNHPNIVRTHDIDSDGKSFHYLIMDYIEGVNLHDLVRKKGPLDAAAAAQYLGQTALGLQHMHDAGLIHRDLTPGNLLLDRFGTIKILDLGLARSQFDNKDPITQRYDEKAVLGTADYLAPEQALHASEVDIRADIYSLGATGFYLLTGRPPFADAKNVTQKLLAHQSRTPESLRALRPDLPPELIAIVERMMAKTPQDRYLTPLEVVQALQPWATEPVPPPADEVLPRRSPVSKGLSSYTGPISQTAMPGPAAVGGRNGTRTQDSPRSLLATGSGTPVPRRKLAGAATRVIEELKRTPRWQYVAAGALLLMAIFGAAIWLQSSDSIPNPPNTNEAR
jgi:eukaryotic-like serine/threonine-protein kinase